MPTNRIRRSRMVRHTALPEALQQLIAGEQVAHTTETRRLLRDIRYLGKFRDALTEADMERVGEAHSRMVREWLNAEGCA